MFAEVAFPISNFKTFTYEIPENLIAETHIGSRVVAPFRKQQIEGIIVNILKSSSFKGETKLINKLIDNYQIVTPELWELINWISNYYMTPLGQVAKTVFPKSLSTRYKPQKLWFVESRIDIDPLRLEKVKKRAPKQYEVLKLLRSESRPIQVSLLKNFASSPLQICKSLERNRLVKLFEKEVKPNSDHLSFGSINKKITLDQNQEEVANSIRESLDSNIYNPYLLHGVTGSGKTEIYIDAVRYCLDKGKTSIILLPEISLTPQIAGRFRSVFGNKVALWHSKLNQQQRSWTWNEICKGTFRVVIGARSAIFSPLKDLGLIVIDEEQEASFRQDSPSPRYHARDVALMRARLNKAVIVLASATPSLESYYNHQKNKLNYLHLPNRFGGAKQPKVHLVDMLNEQEETGKFGQVISGFLQNKVEERLNRNEQVILLQNRRGFSPIIKCGDCGEVAMCPDCNVAFSYHKKTNNLLCHFCGFSKINEKQSCSECDSKNLLYFGAGTQKVQALLEETFPEASIERLDMDTTTSGINITKILTAFNSGQIDILLGTQMIAKGLDFPNATLVGIINADQGLHLPDFRSGERVFQLIYQASGRSGRHQKPGEVVIQTYSPDNPVIRCAAELDMDQYYEIALKEREELDYPPFSWLSKIEITGKNYQRVSKLASTISRKINMEYSGLIILGPAPCYIEKLRGYYRFQIILKSKKVIDPNGKKLHSFIKSNFHSLNQKYSNSQSRITIHFDPLSLI